MYLMSLHGSLRVLTSFGAFTKVSNDHNDFNLPF